MDRRAFLTVTGALLASGGLAGCTALQSRAAEDEPESTPESDSAGESPDGTDSTAGTPDPFPDSCPAGPDVEGLPAVPGTLTEDSVVEFVTEFERVYSVATNDEYRALSSVRETHVESTDGRYRVQLAVEAERETPTPGPDGSTPTPSPADASAHRVRYRLQDEQLVRERLDYGGGRELSSECWTLES